MPTSPDRKDVTEQDAVLQQALAHCEREAIHLVGSVQPHGVLLGLDECFVIRYCSENADTLFAMPWTELMGKSFNDFIGQDTAEKIRTLDGLGDWRSSAVMRLTLETPGGTATHDAAISSNGSTWLVELEVALPDQSELFSQMFVPTRDLLWQLDAEQDLGTYTSKVAELVRLATGYDRVMMYKFDSNWDGEVIAESRSEQTRSYLGNRFPASDIPAQARALYTRNLTRVIADVNAVPAGIHLPEHGGSAAPLDLTYSAYRSLSPVHLEYLRNMGVTATLTISLIQDGKLWGMLACHHKSPKPVTLRERELYELIGKTISIKLSDLKHHEEKRLKERVSRFLLDVPLNNLADLPESTTDELMSIVEATGVVLVSNGCRHVYGHTPSPDQLVELEALLRQHEPEKVFHTDELAGIYPESAQYADSACGILLSPLDNALENYVLWCRGRVTHTRHWAGKPHKELSRTNDGYRISPRQSFENWTQTYHNKSAPWTQLQVEMAADLAQAFIRKISQQSLREEEQNFRNLVELSTTMIVRLDWEGRVTYASAACEQVIGRSAASLEGLAFAELLQDDDAEAFRRLWATLPASGRSEKLILSFLHPDGRCVWAEIDIRKSPGGEMDAQPALLTMHDVTQRHNYQMALEDLHQRNALRLNAKLDGLVSLNESGRISYINPPGMQLLGYQSEDELLGADFREVLRPSNRQGVAYTADQCPVLKALQTGQEKEAATDQFKLKSGQLLPVGYKCIPLRLNNHLTGLLVVFRRHDQLTYPEQSGITNEVVLNQTSEAVVITGPDARILSVNRSFCEITGFEANEVLGQKPSILNSYSHTPRFYQELWQRLRSRGAWEGEIWNRRKTGEIFPSWASISVVRDVNGKARNYVWVFSDNSKAKQAEENLRLARNYDTLTGLPNRQYCLERSEESVDAAITGRHGLAFVLLDLDSFKLLNDSQGHDVGDQYLKVVAGRLADAKPADATLCRWGADEFMLLTPIEDKDRIEGVVQDLFHALSKPLLLPNHELIPSVCAGISFFPEDANTAKGLIQAAETALVRAQESGPANIELFTPTLADRTHRRFEIASELHRAVRKDELRLHFQPQVSSQTGALIGVEALVRWNHPRKGFIPPGDFIPLAEELGMIELVGGWVLAKALEQMATWREMKVEVPRVAVNIAPQQLAPGLVSRVGELLKRYRVPPSALELEITEGALERNEQTVGLLNEIKAMGVQLSIDDFGTGYSSLAHLKHLPVNCFKIDKAFVDGLPEGNFDVAILRAVLALGHSLGVNVLAEGVESEAQFRFLADQGVDSIQGYFFGRPMSAEVFNGWMEDRH